MPVTILTLNSTNCSAVTREFAPKMKHVSYWNSAPSMVDVGRLWGGTTSACRRRASGRIINCLHTKSDELSPTIALLQESVERC
jgi:hypothetical protein